MEERPLARSRNQHAGLVPFSAPSQILSNSMISKSKGKSKKELDVIKDKSQIHQDAANVVNGQMFGSFRKTGRAASLTAKSLQASVTGKVTQKKGRKVIQKPIRRHKAVADAIFHGANSVGRSVGTVVAMPYYGTMHAANGIALASRVTPNLAKIAANKTVKAVRNVRKCIGRACIKVWKSSRPAQSPSPISIQTPTPPGESPHSPLLADQ